MMVCGSIVSSEDLAGAVSGSKAVPVTTTVSISPALEAFAASCWAWALPAKTAKRAQVAERRKNSDFIKITPKIQNPVRAKQSRLRNRYFAKSTFVRMNRIGPAFVTAIARVRDGSVTLAITKINRPATWRPRARDARKSGITSLS
jgi:hypothetical protein